MRRVWVLYRITFAFSVLLIIESFLRRLDSQYLLGIIPLILGILGCWASVIVRQGYTTFAVPVLFFTGMSFMVINIGISGSLGFVGFLCFSAASVITVIKLPGMRI